MDASDVQDLVEDLTSNIDGLETSLSPLLNSAISASTSKLPLLDKAKLYILATYALDSVLFSYLRLNGTDLKSHPVAQEIARVRTYFQKIKDAETGPAQRSATLDKDAAARFIKHGLAGNDRYDAARAERVAAEKAGAKRKADELDREASARWGSQNRFAGAAKRMREDEGEMVTVARASESGEEDAEVAGKVEGSGASGAEMSKEEKKAAKRQRRAERKMAKQSPAGSPAPDDEGADAKKAATAPAAASSGKAGPRSNHDTFQALLQGPLPKKEERKKKKRKTRKEGMQELEDKRAREMM